MIRSAIFRPCGTRVVNALRKCLTISETSNPEPTRWAATDYRYDEAGRLTSVRLPSGAMVRCAYNAENLPISYVDENGGETRLDYVGLGEISRRIQPDGHTVDYLYDPEERLVGVRNQRREVYALGRDALGRIVEETDYWGQSRHYQYSPCGYLQRIIDPLDRTISFQTDSIGRIVKKSRSDDQGDAPFEESFVYDANGNLIESANAHVTVRRVFDAEGHLINEEQAHATGQRFANAHTYDQSGNRIKRTTSLGNTVEFAFDSLDQVIEVRVNSGEPMRVHRDSAGQVTQEELGPGLMRLCQHTADGLLSEQQVFKDLTPLFSTSYEYDRAGNLTARSDSQYGIDRYVYDPLGRILEHTDPQRRLREYLNDPVGDRLLTRVTGRTDEDEVSGPGDSWRREGEYSGVAYRFDRVGNLVLKTGLNSTLELTWDANQRMIESRNDGKRTRYGYDPQGRRVFKETDGQRTCFVWDGEAVAADVTEHAAREFVYYPETFEPLAILTDELGANEVLRYYNDPSGCPVRVLDSSGDVRWAASYSVHGEVSALYGTRINNPIRLQGQYFDPETGLHYNQQRYYDPQIGQFVSQDALRLIAGPNTFAFAPNTTGWIDPLGLVCLDRGVGRFRDPATGRFVGGTQVRGHFPMSVTPPQRVCIGQTQPGAVTHFQVATLPAYR